MPRIDVEPFPENLMRREYREVFDDGSAVGMFDADQNAMPVPTAGLYRFDENQHEAAEKVSGESAEHAFGEEAGMVLEGREDPLVVENFRGGGGFGRPRHNPVYRAGRRILLQRVSSTERIMSVVIVAAVVSIAQAAE